MFYFTQVADMRRAREILFRLCDGIPAAPFEQDFLVHMFGRPVTDPYMARELLQWLDYELDYY
jgi:hypothetical protein